MTSVLWQLLLPLAALVAVAVTVAITKFRRASQVLEELVGQIEELQTDEVGRRRELHETRFGSRMPAEPDHRRSRTSTRRA